jgi:fructose-bisphosphate aldolase, class II
MRTSIHKLFKRAYGNYGIGAFNVFNAEQVHGVFRGSQLSQTPVIIQVTPVARDYIHHEILQVMINAAGMIYPEVEFSVHLDHGNYIHCLSAIETGGYDSIMIDASHETYKENIRITKDIVDHAHARGIAVEAELGVLSGVEDDLSINEKKSHFTDPSQAREFVECTGCDSLAIAIGTSHGAYKFNSGKGLRLDVLKQIQKELPGYPLVLHGASSVPVKEIERINKAGGSIKSDAKGINPDELLQAIQLGICKVNIATDMRLIWTRVHREYFLNEPSKFDMVIPGKIYMDELEKFVANKCQLLKGELKTDMQ